MDLATTIDATSDYSSINNRSRSESLDNLDEHHKVLHSNLMPDIKNMPDKIPDKVRHRTKIIPKSQENPFKNSGAVL